MGFRFATSFLIATILLGATASAERPGVMGFEPALPDTAPRFERSSPAPRVAYTRDVPVVVSIDETGQVTSVTTELPGDSLLGRWLRPHLRPLSFRPALRNGKPVSSTLKVKMTISPRMLIPEIQCPIDPGGGIAAADLYLNTLSANGFEFAWIEQFPSYYYLDREQDTIGKAVPYVVVRLDLDTSGAVIQSEKWLSTAPGFDDQMMSAVNWADFAPTIMGGTAQASTSWLIVSYYPCANYPTRIWQFPDSAATEPWDYLRLRMLPDTIGLMQLPVPRRPKSERFAKRGDHLYHRDTVSMLLGVDTLGLARIVGGDHCDPVVRTVIGQAVAATTFHPAVGFDGYPRPFLGRAVFELTGEAAIRIRYTWLPE